MLKSKITASVLALSIAIPAVSWSSNILEDERLSSQRKTGRERDWGKNKLEDAWLVSSLGAFVFGAGFFFPPSIPFFALTIGTALYEDHVAIPQEQMKEEIKAVRSENILLKNQMHFTQTEMKTLKSDHNILKPQMHSTIEDLSNLKTDTKMLFKSHSEIILKHDNYIEFQKEAKY